VTVFSICGVVSKGRAEWRITGGRDSNKLFFKCFGWSFFETIGLTIDPGRPTESGVEVKDQITICAVVFKFNVGNITWGLHGLIISRVGVVVGRGGGCSEGSAETSDPRCLIEDDGGIVRLRGDCGRSLLLFLPTNA